MSYTSPPPSPSSFLWSIKCAAALARSSSVRASSSSTWAISLIRSISASFRGCFEGWRAETPRLTLAWRAQISQLDQIRTRRYAYHAMLEIKSPILQNSRRSARVEKKKAATLRGPSGPRSNMSRSNPRLVNDLSLCKLRSRKNRVALRAGGTEVEGLSSTTTSPVCRLVFLVVQPYPLSRVRVLGSPQRSDDFGGDPIQRYINYIDRKGVTSRSNVMHASGHESP